MKVLHIFNWAGVPSLLIKGLRQKGHEADLIVRQESRYNFPYEKVVNLSARDFFFHILKLSQKYDLLHIHGLNYLKQFNIDVFALKTIRVKFVLHLHGTRLRLNHDRLIVKLALKLSDALLVSTPDLLSYCTSAIWLPNPVDPIFKPFENLQRRGKALYFRHWYEPEKENLVKKMCREMGLELTIPDKPIPYSMMPHFLNQFEVFFDRFTIPSLSKSALEALARGCKVISWKGPVTNPEEIIKNHSLIVVTEKLLEIYKKILG